MALATASMMRRWAWWKMKQSTSALVTPLFVRHSSTTSLKRRTARSICGYATEAKQRRYSSVGRDEQQGVWPG